MAIAYFGSAINLPRISVHGELNIEVGSKNNLALFDVMMPPTARSLIVPPGFLLPDTEYEWEVLAIEAGGNQTLSSAFFTTSP